MESANYYLSSNQRVTGPYPKNELLDSLRHGVISADCTVREDGKDDWFPITILKVGAEPPQPEAILADGPVNPFAELVESQVNAADVSDNYYKTKSLKLAIWLEVLPGILLQTFGIGNLYAGNKTKGLLLMFGYWATLLINIPLAMIVIGFVTWPLTCLAFAVIAILAVRKKINRSNFEVIMKGDRKI